MEPLDPGDPQRIGEYTILGRLGAGGMGQVFLGQSPEGSRVAVKVMHEWLARDSSFRSRFRQEVEAVQRVGGGFTAPVVASDPEHARPWLATAFVDGPSLADAVERDGPLRVERVLPLARGLAEALIGIHRAGVLHRDLKPSNVLLGPDGPRVIDFGIARAVDATRLTGTGLLVGTPGFMAPEQVRGEEPTAASDVFSLGAMLFYASTGASPFGSGPPHALLYQVVHGEPDLARLPVRLRPLVAACLDKNPDRRPSLLEIIRSVDGPPGTRLMPDPSGPTETVDRPVTLPHLGPWQEPRASRRVPPGPGGTVTPRPPRRITRIASVVAGVLVLIAGAASLSRGLFDGQPGRGGPAVVGQAAGTTRDITIGIGIASEPASYNVNSYAGADTGSLLLANLVLRGFSTLDPRGTVKPDPAFGTVTKVSDSPLTVRYSIAAGATWSDDVPVSCDDAVLTWLANANVTGLEGFESNDTTGYADQNPPDCTSGAKEFTVTYRKPSADWEALYGTGALLPSHVVEKQAGLPQGELVKLSATPTSTRLRPAIAFYNTGWSTDQGRPATALLPSSGPYVIDRWGEDSLELSVNPRWWGTPPRAARLVLRFGSDTELVEALRVGRVNVLVPLNTQPSGVVAMRQVLRSFSVAQEFTTSGFQSLVINYGGAFSDQRLRQALALCVPREQVVRDLIRPVNSKAQVLQTRIVPAIDPRYDEIAEAAGGEQYRTTDVDQARRLLTAAGKVGTTLRIGWWKPANPSQRSQRTVDLIRQSCGAAGFKVVDSGKDDFYSNGLGEREFEAALLGWDSRPTPGSLSHILRSERDDPAAFNYGGYDNPEVDGWLDELATELDPDRQFELEKQIERQLWDDLPTVPLYALPAVVFLDKKVTGVVPNGTMQGLTWDAARWDLR